MKKIVVIMIIGIYIGSIFLLNFFGLKYVPHELNVYVEKIVCNTISDRDGTKIDPFYKEEKTDPDTGQKTIIKHFSIIFKASKDEGGYTADIGSLAKNPNYYKINFDVFPNTANYQAVNLIYDKTYEGKRFVVDQDEMAIIFLKASSPPKSITITIVSADGSNIQETISILVKNK